MEHKSLTLDEDAPLINTILDDIDMRYILLFLYVIRNDLFKDLSDQTLIESYTRVIIMDDIFKNNLIDFWDEEFTDIYIDLGLVKNIRSKREFDQKDGDFIIKLGEETVTIEQDTISVPDDTLFLIINKKFKSLTRRNFNLALTRLKGVRCERSSVIHPLIYEIGEHDYTLSDDLYYILDQYGNIYQAIKIEVTIEGFFQRFKEISEEINEYITIFDPKLNTVQVLKKIDAALEEDKDIFNYLKDQNIELSDKFNFDKIDKENALFKQWNSTIIEFLKSRHQMGQIEKKITELKANYSGKEKKLSYLTFVEMITYNEDNLLNNIQTSLVELRNDLVSINKEISKFAKKELRLLNLDYERLIITSSDD